MSRQQLSRRVFIEQRYRKGVGVRLAIRVVCCRNKQEARRGFSGGFDLEVIWDVDQLQRARLSGKPSLPPEIGDQRLAECFSPATLEELVDVVANSDRRK